MFRRGCMDSNAISGDVVTQQRGKEVTKGCRAVSLSLSQRIIDG